MSNETQAASEEKNGKASLSPFKQNLIKKYRKPLEYLREVRPRISFSFSNAKLNQDMAAILASLDFTIRTTGSQDTDKLLKQIPLWLHNNNVVLLHYRPESGDINLINLLRGIKSHARKVSFKNLIPVFFVAYSSKKQMEIFRILGVFGIQHVIFVTPNVPIESNEVEILDELIAFGRLLKTEASLEKSNFDESSEPGGESGQVLKGKPEAEEQTEAEVQKLRKYEALIKEANELMQAEQYEKAILLFTKAVELKPDSGILLLRGDAYFRQKNYLNALQDYRQAATLEQSLSEPFAKISSCCFILVKDHIAKGEKEQASKILTLGMENIKKAKQKIDELIQKNKDFPEKIPENPYASLISTLVDSDIRSLGIDAAEKELNDLTAKVLSSAGSTDYMDSSIDIDVRIDYALLMTRNGNHEKAETILRSIIKEDPEHVGPVLNNFAIELRKGGQNGKAFEIYTELLDYKVPDREIVIENHKTAGIHYGSELREDFKMDAAITVYKKILEFRPKGREWVLCELAMTYLELQDQAQASCRLMEAIYINPDIMESKLFDNYHDLANLRSEMVKKLTESSGLKKPDKSFKV